MFVNGIGILPGFDINNAAYNFLFSWVQIVKSTFISTTRNLITIYEI